MEYMSIDKYTIQYGFQYLHHMAFPFKDAFSKDEHSFDDGICNRNVNGYCISHYYCDS